MANVLITNGRVIDPASNLDKTLDVAIHTTDAGPTIADIGQSLPKSPADRVIDAEGCIVTPGLIDPHVHLREPGSESAETIETGTRTAVSGGFTTVCCMPNTTPALDTPEMLELVARRARDKAHCRVFPVAAATQGRKGQQLTEFDLLAAAGAVGFSDDGDAVASPGVMAAVLAATKHTGLTFMQHCQEPTLTVGSVMHAGDVATRLGLTGWPRVAEELIIERDIRLNRDIGARYHVQHLSSGGSVDIVRSARAAGMPVTAEASPHHLLLTHDAIDTKGGYFTNAKMNPPLREQSDIDAIRAGIADNTITVLATDHAPHTADRKAEPFAQAPFGIVGLETALALYIKALLDTHTIDWPRLVAMMTIEPARLCNLDRLGLGTLTKGGPADVTIIDPAHTWQITQDTFKGKSNNSPFLGTTVTGKAIATIANGTIAHHEQPERQHAN